MDLFEYSEPVEHASLVLNGLNKQRKTSPKLCDFAISIGKKKYPCHRSVLCLFSSFFKATIEGDFKENDEHFANIQDVPCDAIESILEYLYTGKICLDHSCVESLLSVATRLGFAKVIELCIDYIRQQIDQTNCLEILKLAKQENYNALEVSARQYLLNHLCLVFEYEPAETSIELHEVEELLQDAEAHQQGEEEVVLSILTWLKKDLKYRKAYAKDLLRYVQWKRLPAPFLLKVLLRHPLLEADVDVKNHVLDHVRKSYDDGKRNSIKLKPPHNGNVMVTSTAAEASVQSNQSPENQTSSSPSYRNHRPQKVPHQALLLVGGLSLGEAERGDTSQPNVMCYHPVERFWKRCAAWPERGLRGFSVSKFNNDVIVSGGCSTTVNKHVILRRAWIYEVAIAQWRQLPDMVKPRAFHSGCQVNSQFYAVGGATGSILCVEFYDPHKSGWTWLKKNVPRMMYNFTTSGCNSKLILIGSGQSSSVFLQCYNPAIDQWTVVRSPNVPRHLSAPVSATLADESKIFVSGDNTKKLYAFDPNKNSWSRAADMNNLHSNGNLVLLGNELFHTGGHWEEDGYWDEMESYDIAQNTWNPRGALPHLWLYHGCAPIFINE